MSFSQFLNFIRLTDDDGVISLTHIALYICMVKLCLASPASVADIGALFISISAYSYKKWLGAQAPQNVSYDAQFHQKFEELEQKIKEAQGKVTGVALNQALNPNGFR